MSDLGIVLSAVLCSVGCGVFVHGMASKPKDNNIAACGVAVVILTLICVAVSGG